MQQLTSFQFHTHSIRVFPTDDGVSFYAVAADVARALEYGSAKDMLRCVDDEDTGWADLPTLGGTQRMRTINESGIYTATIRSQKPSAKPFRRWVTADVLPAIRRNGGYVHPAAADSAQSQLALAQEVGFLKTQLAHREQMLAAKDQAIIGLQGDLIGSLKGQNKLLGRVSKLEKRLSATEAKEMVILMESQGFGRAEIAARTGKTRGHIRVIVCNAKLAGRLPNQGELNLEEKP